MTDNSGENQEKETDQGRRTFIAGAASAGILGALAMSSAQAQQALAIGQDPQPPAGLGPRAMVDKRFPLTYQTSVPEGVRVLMQYFAALSRRDLKGVAELVHFPFVSIEGTEPVAIESPEKLLARAPASL